MPIEFSIPPIAFRRNFYYNAFFLKCIEKAIRVSFFRISFAAHKKATYGCAKNIPEVG